jgi:hypothetical protein
MNDIPQQNTLAVAPRLTMQFRVICHNPPELEAHDQFGILDRILQIYAGHTHGSGLQFNLEVRVSTGRDNQPSLGAIWLHGRPDARQLVLALRRKSLKPRQLEHRVCIDLIPDWSLVQQALHREGLLSLVVDLQNSSFEVARVSWELNPEPIMALKQTRQRQVFDQHPLFE